MRQHQRRNLNARAKIILDQPKHIIDCIVRDISEGGARLELRGSTDEVPEEFGLAIYPSARRRLCSVAWRRDKQIGVKFA